MSPKSGEEKTSGDVDMEAKVNEIITEGVASVKMEEDFSSVVAEKIPIAQSLASAGKLDEALEVLVVLEKQTRSGADTHSTSKVLVAIVQICFQAKAWETLNEHVILMTKRRSQLKIAVTKMVQECYSWIKEGKMPSQEIELKLIETLRSVTEGKIYVEVERARLTHRLSQIQEKDGKFEDAAKTMQELQVETYGSMERKEKVELILEQMRLCLAVKDYIRTQIISKKISIRFFENVEYAELKLKFYQYMIELDQHEGTYLNICRHYRAIFDTPCIQEDSEKKLNVMRHVALYIILAPHDNEQSDLLHRILEQKVMEEIPIYKSLLKTFVNMEIIRQDDDLCRPFEVELKSDATQVFDQKAEKGIERWNDLKSRVVEHNIRIMAKYYTRITLTRMSELLNLDKNQVEDFLSTMVVNKTVEAKTDRLNEVVDFSRHQDPNDRLNDWSNNISNLMGLVLKTTHLINKEEMVHKHLIGSSKSQ